MRRKPPERRGMRKPDHRQDIIVQVEGVAFGGSGIARLSDGKVCFIPYVIAGEKVKARIRAMRSSYAEADLSEVIEASADRVRPKCPVFGRCGGCQYQHVSYAKQLALKSAQVAEVLQRLGGIRAAPVEPTIPSSREYNYRNRITVHAESGQVGFFASRSRRIVEVKECPIANERVNTLLGQLRSSQPKDGIYPLREFTDYRGFRQVNDAVAERLLEVVEEMAKPGNRLLVDAYCGAGFFARRLANFFEVTIGIEWSSDAIRAAREKAGPREIYLFGDVKRHLVPALAAAPSEGTTLLLDPPEGGIEAEVLEAIASKPPHRLIYVSCNPATLARDLKHLAQLYMLERVCPLDMFPQTSDVEVVAALKKLSSLERTFTACPIR
jgi:tRNA/tmRNA/rRNA uracil-C5-methylase (TrmA/RlmC/RlmD family)